MTHPIIIRSIKIYGLIFLFLTLPLLAMEEEGETKKSEEKKQAVAKYLEEHKKEFTELVLKELDDDLGYHCDARQIMRHILDPYLDLAVFSEHRKKLKQENKAFCALCDRQDEEEVLKEIDRKDLLLVLYKLCDNQNYKASTFLWFKALLKVTHWGKYLSQKELDNALDKSCGKPCKLPFIQYVVKRGANPNARFNGTPVVHRVLTKTRWQGCREHCKYCSENIPKLPVLKYLLQQGGNPETRNSDGNTLTEAAEELGIKLQLGWYLKE